MHLQVSWDRIDGVLVASPVGRVQSANSAEFHEALQSGIPPGQGALILDLRHLSHMGSAGLRVLLILARRFRGSGRAIAICGLSPALAAIVSLSGFDKIIPVYGTRAEALGSIPRGDDAEAGADDAEAEADDAGTEPPGPDGKRPGSPTWTFKMHST